MAICKPNGYWFITTTGDDRISPVCSNRLANKWLDESIEMGIEDARLGYVEDEKDIPYPQVDPMDGSYV